MKTDRFSDIIRRKLESIRPEFSEKDWARMQSTLQNANVPQPGSPGTGQPFTTSIWSSHPWMMAAATVSTAVLVSVGIWQRREINQLRQAVSQLNEQRAVQQNQRLPEQKSPDDIRTDAAHANALRPETSEAYPATTSQANRQSGRPDTVYINRYVAVPSKSQSEAPELGATNQRTESPTTQRYVTTNRAPASTDVARQSTNQPSTRQTTPYDVTSPSPEVISNNSSSVAKTESPGQPENERVTPDRTVTDPANAAGKVSENLTKNTPGTERSTEKGQVSGHQTDKSQASGNLKERSRGSKSTTPHPTNAVDNSAGDVAQSAPVQPEATTETGRLVTSYELASSRPLSTNSVNWNALLAQRSRRMQPARVVSVAPVAEPAKAPESQPVQQLAFRFRAGLGGELASRLLSVGLFTETLIGTHLRVGVGLSQTTYDGSFINDYDFDSQTRRDFRKEFARTLDPRREIFNINTQTVRIQIPVSLGYRIPLGQTFSLVPTIGTSLNLSSVEHGTFYCPVFIPQQRGGFDEYTIPAVERSVALINSLALGTGIEWQRRHWVVQTSPVLTLPMQYANDPNWQNSTTLGLRARVLFQF